MWLSLISFLWCNPVVPASLAPSPCITPRTVVTRLSLWRRGQQGDSCSLPPLPLCRMNPTLYRAFPSLWRQPVLPHLKDGIKMSSANLPPWTFGKIWVLPWVQGGTWHLSSLFQFWSHSNQQVYSWLFIDSFGPSLSHWKQRPPPFIFHFFCFVHLVS